ncbi:MAG: hypothetical protein KF706_06865 [Chitinophagales bacterium]|nr:hypothetical protein [Chitinophagales bacterium]
MNTLDIQNPEQLFQSQKVFGSIALDNTFQKKVRVLVLHETATDLSEEDRGLAEKILGAAKVSTQEFLILNVFQESLSVHQAIQLYQPEVILVFSESKYTLGKNMSLPLFEILEIGGAKILRSVPLSVLPAHKNEREVLWKRLQTLFNLK